MDNIYSAIGDYIRFWTIIAPKYYPSIEEMLKGENNWILSNEEIQPLINGWLADVLESRGPESTLTTLAVIYEISSSANGMLERMLKDLFAIFKESRQ